MANEDRSTLNLLTEERIQNAFEATLTDSETLPGAKFTVITPDLYESVKKVGNDGFTHREPLSLASGMVWEGPAADEFWDISLKQGISIAIVNDDHEVLAIRVIRWQTTDVQAFDPSKLEDESKKKCYGFVAYSDEQANFPAHFPTNEIFHLLGLVVPEQYAKRGYATKTMEFVMKFLKNMQLGKDIYVKVEATSNYSKKVYDKLGFTCIHDQPYAEYVIDGQRVLNDTGIHRSMKIYGKCIKAES